MNYIITDITNTVLLQDEITAAADWSIQNIGFAVGANNICIETAYADGSIITKELTILNYCKENMAALGVNLEDSDGDGLHDGEELAVYGTNPCNPDTDGNEIIDSGELVQLIKDAGIQSVEESLIILAGGEIAHWPE